jgi:hypothetical protein
VRALRIIAIMLSCVSSGAIAASTEKAVAALRDAHQLVDCMMAFDTACVIKSTYTEYLQRQGTTPQQLEKSVANVYAQLRAMGGKFTRIDLAQPTDTFSGDVREFIFIPYDQVLQLSDRQIRTRSYLIGISQDSGKTWRFVDGVKITRENIQLIIPSYGGRPPLPRSH